MLNNVLWEKESYQQKSTRLSVKEREFLSEVINGLPAGCLSMMIGENTVFFHDALNGMSFDNAKIVGISLYGLNLNAGEMDTIIPGSKSGNTEKQSLITIFTERSAELARRWKKPVCLLIIMSYQYCEEVKAAVACWKSHLSPDAAIVIFDCSQPGPRRAIKELSGDGGNFIIRQSVGSMTSLLLDRCRHHWKVNSNDVGVCKNCGRNRNFKLLQKDIMNDLHKKRETKYISKKLS